MAARELAVRGRPAEPGRLDRDHRPQPRDRPVPARVVALRPLRAGRRSASRATRKSRSIPLSDDRLRLIFTCCHPALAPSAQVALTLRLLGGLQTPEIARAFLVPEATMAQRLVRAKNKIRAAQHPVPHPRRRRALRPAAAGAGGRLPDLQRGPHGDERRRAHARRPERRGDPPGAAAGRADARRGGGARACSRCCC